jgi:hypothetical protein
VYRRLAADGFSPRRFTARGFFTSRQRRRAAATQGLTDGGGAWLFDRAPVNTRTPTGDARSEAEPSDRLRADSGSKVQAPPQITIRSLLRSRSPKGGGVFLRVLKPVAAFWSTAYRYACRSTSKFRAERKPSGRTASGCRDPVSLRFSLRYLGNSGRGISDPFAS